MQVMNHYSPALRKKKPKPASLTMNEKKRKAASISSTLTDCKNDHEKKLLSVKFEAANLTLATVQEKMKKDPVVGAMLKGNFTSHLKSIMEKHKQVNMHYADDVFTLCAFTACSYRQAHDPRALHRLQRHLDQRWTHPELLVGGCRRKKWASLQTTRHRSEASP